MSHSGLGECFYYKYIQYPTSSIDLLSTLLHSERHKTQDVQRTDRLTISPRLDHSSSPGTISNARALWTEGPLHDTAPAPNTVPCHNGVFSAELLFWDLSYRVAHPSGITSDDRAAHTSHAACCVAGPKPGHTKAFTHLNLVQHDDDCYVRLARDV
jgi:hypothetical protein